MLAGRPSKLGPSMKVGIIAAMLAGALLLGAGLGLYVRSVGNEIADIHTRLVTKEQLARPNDPETASAIKLAPVQCERVYDLRANPIARRLQGGAIRALWEHCQRIADIASGLDKIERQTPP
jgi:hypothetical protein